LILFNLILKGCFIFFAERHLTSQYNEVKFSWHPADLLFNTDMPVFFFTRGTRELVDEMKSILPVLTSSKVAEVSFESIQVFSSNAVRIHQLFTHGRVMIQGRVTNG
jgi:hypothetical protein